MIPTTWLFSLVQIVPGGAGEEWPQYNGPHGNRTTAGLIAGREWPEEGPPEVWRVPTNAGFSSFTVADGKVFTLVSRPFDGDEHETCIALDVGTGRELWAAPLGRTGYDGGGDSGASGNSGGDGSRSTPSFADGKVYVLDSHLLLACFDAATGATVWRTDLVADHAGRLITWQSAASPLIDGGRVFVAGGGAGQSLLAFDAGTGEVLWKTGDERMTHATPVAATLHGVRQVVFFLQSGLVAVAPETGAELWRQEYPYRTSTAASPVVFEDVVYCSAGYGVGAGAFVIVEDEGAFQVEPLWRKRNDLINHWSTPVCKDGYLYGMFGFKDYGEGPLQCVELASGEVKWSVEGFGPGNCILVGSDLVALSDSGEVVLVEATPDAYRERARAEVLEGKCWSTPTYCDGRLFVRSTREGVCLDVSGNER